jgi:NADH-quinone oxidoreductase subunit J
MMASFVFYLFAAAAVLGAVMCILQRSPVASAVWLMTTMFSLAGIYILLNAQLIGVLQVLVYVGAILVLFLFVVMLLNVGREGSDLRGPSMIAATLVIVGLLAIETLVLARYSPARLAREVAQAPEMTSIALAFPAGQLAQQDIAARGVVGAIAAPMFQTYLVPFEITSVLLLTALVGAVVLAKRRI